MYEKYVHTLIKVGLIFIRNFFLHDLLLIKLHQQNPVLTLSQFHSTFTWVQSTLFIRYFTSQPPCTDTSACTINPHL